MLDTKNFIEDVVYMNDVKEFERLQFDQHATNTQAYLKVNATNGTTEEPQIISASVPEPQAPKPRRIRVLPKPVCFMLEGKDSEDFQRLGGLSFLRSCLRVAGNVNPREFERVVLNAMAETIIRHVEAECNVSFG